MAGVPCQHLPVACLYCDACRLSGGVLSGRTVCRFWNQRVLPAGFGVWLDSLEQRKEKKNIQQAEEETPITRMPRKVYFPLTAVFILCWVVIAWILITWTDSSVPWTDSFTTALSIIAMWMLARKYVEQWGAWMIVDWVCCGLYIYKGLYFTSALYGLYAVVAFFGWRKWLNLMTEQAYNQTNKE